MSTYQVFENLKFEPYEAAIWRGHYRLLKGEELKIVAACDGIYKLADTALATLKKFRTEYERQQFGAEQGLAKFYESAVRIDQDLRYKPSFELMLFDAGKNANEWEADKKEGGLSDENQMTEFRMFVLKALYLQSLCDWYLNIAPGFGLITGREFHQINDEVAKHLRTLNVFEMATRDLKQRSETE